MANEKYCGEHSGICQLIEAIRKELDLRFDALDKLIASTRKDLDQRLEGMNHLQTKLDNLGKSIVPRSEIDLARDKLEDKIDLLVRRSATSEGSSRWIDHIITVLIGLAIILIVWMVKK